MTIGLTYPELRALNPCHDSLRRVARLMGGARKWNGNKITAAAARAVGVTFSDIAWAASTLAQSDSDVKRRVRLWIADCAAHMLQHFEAERPDDMRLREAIVAGRRFARGEIDSAAWDAAGAAWAAAWAAAWQVTWDATGEATGEATRDAERAWQFDRLIARLSDDEPQDWPMPGRSSKTKEAA